MTGKKENTNGASKDQSGRCLCTEAYTDEDWEKYGDNIALEKVDSEYWLQWVSDNWAEELYRRRMNYTLPYYKSEGSITWFADTDWIVS